MSTEAAKTAGEQLQRRRRVGSACGAGLIALVCALLAASAVAAEPTPSPAWGITSIATPTNFEPGATDNSYEVRIANVGAAATDGTPVTITDTLAAGLTVTDVEFRLRYKHLSGGSDFGSDPAVCQTDESGPNAVVSCTIPEELAGSGEESAVVHPAEEIRLVVVVSTDPSVQEGDVLLNSATVEGGGAPGNAAESENEVSSEPAPTGFAEYAVQVTGPDGQPVTDAGSHPYQFTTSFSFNTRRAAPGAEEAFAPSGGDPKDAPVVLPPGLVGNPTAATRCDLQKFNTSRLYEPFFPESAVQLQLNECPASSVVGYITVRRAIEADTSSLPIYNLTPPPGMPAQLGFQILELPVFIDTEVRPSSNYRVVGISRNITEAKRVIAASVTLWGNPADERHDPIRGGECLNPKILVYPISIKDCPAGVAEKPFLRLPTSCSDRLEFTMGLSTWAAPRSFAFATDGMPAPVGCDMLEFDPGLRAQPTTDVADSPSGLQVDLHLPQNDDPDGRGTADVRKAVVTFPEGVSVNPSSANGLAGCTPSQIGRDASSASGFDDDPASCPPASRIGRVEVDTPLLDEPLQGGLYVAMPFDNPFNSLLAVYIAVNDPVRGIVVKLAGQVRADPRTGQLTTTFDDNPQVPFDHFKVHLFDGPLAALRTPAVCRTHTSTSSMTPWSAPESGPPATPSDAFATRRAPTGGPCPPSPGRQPNAPSLDAGTVAPIAGQFSRFVLRLRREDGSQELSGLSVTMPPGLLGRLAGIPYCPEVALAVAEAKKGKAEKVDPSCPLASRVGTVGVAAGVGPSPYHAHGAAYLAGPYKGAPVSLAIVTPATAGPYDLGTVVVRSALHVDPATALITAVSDPVPHILHGIPLAVRSVTVDISKRKFTLNPTSCDPMSVTGQMVSVLRHPAPLLDRFQVAGCRDLRFKPRLKLRLKGRTKRGNNPRLIATFISRPGEANPARASVRLARSAFLDNSHIRTICTRVQWAANACPRGSIYGRAFARTPLLDYPLTGRVYLRSSDNTLPDLVADLRGPAHQPVRFELVGRTDAVRGALRNTFDFIPDAPVSRFRLELFGGKRGLVVNSRDICRHRYRAYVKLNGHNGKIHDTRPILRNDCQRKKRKHRRRGENMGLSAASIRRG